MVYQAIKALVQYGLEKGLLTEDDAIYARNQILEALKMDEYEKPYYIRCHRKIITMGYTLLKNSSVD